MSKARLLEEGRDRPSLESFILCKAQGRLARARRRLFPGILHAVAYTPASLLEALWSKQ